MFEIGFMELVLVAVVALLVIGPERLPGAVRTASLWIGRAKRSFNQVKSEIEREINADEIRRTLHNESIMADLDKAKKKADTFVKQTQNSLNTINAEVNATLKAEEQSLAAATAPARQPLPTIMPPPVPAAQAQGQEQPAASEENPARFDEDFSASVPAEADSESAGSATSATPVPAVKAEPVVDFYNNPPKGVIKLRNGVFSSSPAASDDDKGHESK